MPSVLNYPGVYVEEIPSGVRTIVGGSTSDTAFVDFFTRGPLDSAERITSFGDFVRRFGGLDSRSEASYAIQQYYLNGGTIAWVVRVDPANEDDALKMNTASLSMQGGSPPQETLIVRAANPGEWGNNLHVQVQHISAFTFNLTVQEVGPRTNEIVNQEVHRNLTVGLQDARYFVRIVNQDSTLVEVVDNGLGDLPENMATARPLEGGDDGKVFKPDGAFANNEVHSLFSQAIVGDDEAKSGLHTLKEINLLCVPCAANLNDEVMGPLIGNIQKFCKDKRAFFIVDIPERTKTAKEMLLLSGTIDRDDHSAIYYPRLLISDSLRGGRPRNVGPSGTLAGVYPRTDAERGTWKAPAGTDAILHGVLQLADELNDQENGELNPQGINVLRNFPIYRTVSWGARTLKGSDQEASEWKYVPVRRTALYIAKTLYNSLKWVVFEPNDEPLWAQIRLSVGGFMNTLFRQGAFQGKMPRQAYLVKCDSETTTQQDINSGVVNILVGFAPLKPAEFVVVKIQQLAGQVEV